MPTLPLHVFNNNPLLSPWHLAGAVLVVSMAVTSIRIRRGWPFFCFFLWHYPSTCLHELSHFVVAILTGARPTNLDLIPRIEKEAGKGWRGAQAYRMGCVTCTRLGALNSAPVGLAPVSLMPAAYLAYHYWRNFFPVDGANTIAMYALIFILLQGAIPSGQDFRIAFRIKSLFSYLFIAAALLVVATYLRGVLW